MNSRSLETLEFPKVLAALASHTSFSASRALALALVPSPDVEVARRGQRLASELRRLLELQPSFTIGGARDVRASVQRASIGGVLTPSDLLDVLATIRSSRNVRAAITHYFEELPLLDEIAARITDLGRLEFSLASSLTEDGDVTDSASPKLGRIRADAKVAFDRLQGRLHDILRSPAHTRAIQDPIVTQREGRYVIPIKAEYRSHFRGIVHDQSASGATLFVEPLETVELANRWRQLLLDERDEVQRILTELSAAVGSFYRELTQNVSALAEIDLSFAKARYAAEKRCTEPALCDGDGPDCYTDLHEARHPLLTGQVVPIDVCLGPDFKILVITGPNTGGKTVALKTVGLHTVMAQAGIPIPARSGSRVRVYRSVFADIGDEQSIEQSLSTFSGHLTNIVGILRQADSESLVLLDELGAGTDPAEGAALARSLLEHLLERGITAMATTHYSELKAYAHLTPGVQNASVEFDVESLAPTYRLSIGIPGRSNALAIATRLGLDRGIIDLAASFLSPEQREVEELLTQIQAERDRAAAARAAADQAREDARKLQRRLADEWRQIESQRRDILERAREQAETELAEVRRRLRRALAEAERQGGRAAATVANDELGAAAQVLSRRPAPAPRPQPVVAESLPAPKLRAGSRVLVASLGHEGELVSLPDERGEAEVTFGSFKMRVRADDLQPASGPAPRRVTPDYTPTFVASRPSPGMELDLRGARADEALERVDEYLNDAYLAGLKTVRLIHGKGTGALRQAVRQHLKGHSLVKDFDTAPPREGGEGVTLATLAS